METDTQDTVLKWEQGDYSNHLSNKIGKESWKGKILMNTTVRGGLGWNITLGTYLVSAFRIQKLEKHKRLRVLRIVATFPLSHISLSIVTGSHFPGSILLMSSIVSGNQEEGNASIQQSWYGRGYLSFLRFGWYAVLWAVASECRTSLICSQCLLGSREFHSDNEYFVCPKKKLKSAIIILNQLFRMGDFIFGATTD